MSEVILIVDDESRYRDLYANVLESAGFSTRSAASAEEASAIVSQVHPGLIISDVRMPGASGIELLRATRNTQPDIPFLLVTAFADVRDAVRALKLGAVDYLAKPVDLDELLAAVRDALGMRAAREESEVPADAMRGIISVSPRMNAVFQNAYRIAKSDVSVLLTGESGVGKEVVASFVHNGSPRRGGPLVAVNCAAIPAPLLASELFGHEKGAFTGAATRRLGRFREAEGGTLFLDEIGDMPAELQTSLLRVLESGRVTPLGSDKDVEVDYRLLVATNRDLSKEIEAGRFRRDLFYRINVIALEIPPLRERPEDILPLARHFLARGSSESRRLSRAAMRALTSYSWPGNVRELANAMEHARLLAQTDVILAEHLPPAVRAGEPIHASRPETAADAQTGFRTLEESEIDTIRLALEQTGGNRTRAAELLGITRRGLIYKLKRLGLR